MNDNSSQLNGYNFTKEYGGLHEIILLHGKIVSCGSKSLCVVAKIIVTYTEKKVWLD